MYVAPSESAAVLSGSAAKKKKSGGRLPPHCSLARRWLQPRPRHEDQPAAGAATAAAAAAMRHLGLFPAPDPRITSAPTVSACAAHNSEDGHAAYHHTQRTSAHARTHTPAAHGMCPANGIRRKLLSTYSRVHETPNLDWKAEFRFAESRFSQPLYQ